MKRILAFAALAALWVGSAQATPINIPLSCISPGLPSQCAEAVAGTHITADVVGSTLILKAGYDGIQGVIASLFVDDDTGQLSFLSLTNGTGMSFSAGAPLTPPDLPAGNVFGFTADTALSADADSPAPTNGISLGDGLLTITYQLTGVLDVLGDIQNSSFAVGAHVISLPCGTTDGCEGTTSVSLLSQGQEGGGGNNVPEPPSFALLGAGLLGAGFVGRRKRKSV